MSDDADDAERFPTLGKAGRRMLAFLRHHPAAPIYRNASGNRLRAADVAQLRQFEREVGKASVGWEDGQLPHWMVRHVASTFASVPYYRKRGAPPLRFDGIAPICRADLARDIARFVPDHVPLERLINFRTTGTTGHPLFIPSHPVVAARYLAYHKRALRRTGIALTHGAGQVGVVLLGFQRTCFTYVSVTPTMGESGLAKINLHPGDWRHPDDRARYLDALAPEIVAGDPISFTELLALPVTMRPRALISVSMTLLHGLRARLEQRFGCPVLDVYSLNEVGPVAVHDAAAGGHVLLQPQLYVEILDREGRCVAPGERGEITVTGGFNFCLPLLRYRTGDYAALERKGVDHVLVGLSGRAPVRYRLNDGTWINNIDVTHALQPLPLAHFGLHQAANGALTLRLAPDALHLGHHACAVLARLFGGQSIAVTVLGSNDKIIQYTSACDGALT